MKIVESIIALFSLVVLANGGGSSSFLEPNCGTSISGSEYARVIGGHKADMFGHPWMAYISTSSSVCGGSLITNRFVLTAAHCLENSYTVVHLGAYHRYSPFPSCSEKGCLPKAIRIPVDEEIPHPKYVDARFKYDIALLRLSRSVAYTDYVKPICLLTKYYPLVLIKYLTITGWGRTETGELSDVLKTHTVPQRDRSECSYLFYRKVDMSQICAGNSDSKSCKGDSGSPVSAKVHSRTVQFGVVSFADKNCSSLEVYTNVMYFMGWIKQVLRSETPRYDWESHPNYPPFRHLFG